MSGPRKITAAMPLDDVEGEIFFTRSGLKADPDAQDLLPLTADWLSTVDAARQKERIAREAQADTDAARTVANSRLDASCERFGDDLFLAVGKDRTAARWVQFFSTTVSKFVRQALPKQTTRVRGWMGAKDPVLDTHRAELDQWSKAAELALGRTAALATIRGEARVAREDLADDLTRERDGLHDALSARAREKGLPREWPDQFFRKANRPEAEEEMTAEQTAGG